MSIVYAVSTAATAFVLVAMSNVPMIKSNDDNTNVNTDVNTWPSVEEDHTKLQIVVPDTLQIKGGYQHRDALFGYPSYAKGSLQTQLIDANSTACDMVDLDKMKANWEPPFALLIQRGDCHFVAKVRNAQHAGARAVIISDNSCLCTDAECMTHTGDSSCEMVLPFMADDESGGDISIPSMLIRKSDAMKIVKAMTNTNGLSNVMVQFDWGIPSPDGRVEWTLWHSSWDQQSMQSLKEMQNIVTALGKRAFFTPRFVSYNGTKVGCHQTVGGVNPCGNMCLNKGRYCLLDPSPFHDQAFGASGADVVRENLRRKCIWNVTSPEDPGVGQKWWDYVNDFAEKCNQDELHFADNNCAIKVMKSHSIDAKKVESCMQPYGPDVDEDNAFLDEEVKEQTNLQLLRLPALFVDGVHARGRISGITSMSMICAGYGDHDPPAVCDCVDQSAAEMMACVEKGSSSALAASTHNGVGFGSVLFIVLFVALGIASVGYVYYRRTQRQMREQVRSILAEYMPLEDQSLIGGMDSPRGMHPAALASAMSPRGFMPSEYDDNDEEDDGV